MLSVKVISSVVAEDIHPPYVIAESSYLSGCSLDESRVITDSVHIFTSKGLVHKY